MKLATFATLLCLVAMPARAGPLCRDGKGLFTPCTPAESARRHRTPKPAAPVENAATPGEAMAGEAKPGPARRVHTTRPAKPATIGRGKLCRDGKGLFTPCTR